MKIRSIVFIFLLASVQSLDAQSQYQTAEDSDPKALDYLQSVEEYVNEMPALEVEFNLTASIPGEEAFEQSGQLVQQGDAFKVEMSEGYNILSDAKLRWIHMPLENEVNIYNADDGTALSSPGDYMKIYASKDFVFRLVGTEQIDGTEANVIEAKPVDKDSDYAKLRVIGFVETPVFHSIELFTKDGSRLTLMLDKVRAGEKRPAEFFRFDPSKYPGIHIEDLRID